MEILTRGALSREGAAPEAPAPLPWPRMPRARECLAGVARGELGGAREDLLGLCPQAPAHQRLAAAKERLGLLGGAARRKPPPSAARHRRVRTRAQI